MRILIVSPSFAPDPQVGGLRMSSLAAYLCRKGDEVTVLRCLRPENPPYEPPEGMRIRQVDLQDLYPTDGRPARRRRFREREASRRFVAAARQALGERKYDALVISMGPFYTQNVCGMARREFGVPCVLDFRDPGALDRRKQRGWKKRIWNRIYRAMMFVRESRAVRAADSVVTVVPGWAEDLRRAYRLPPGKTRLIANGFDDEKLAGLRLVPERRTPAKECLKIACFGKLTYYSHRYSVAFFRALSRLAGEGYDVRLLHLGRREDGVDGILAEAGFPGERYENVPFCPYEEGMRRLCGAQLLLLIDESPAAVATKLYDYIRLNLPILFVGPPDTEQARLTASLPGGFAASGEEDVYRAIESMCASGLTRLLPQEEIDAYGRSAQNAKYRELLSRAANRRAERIPGGDIRTGRLYQYALEKLRLQPLAGAAAHAVRGAVRLGLALGAGGRALPMPGEEALRQARARLNELYAKPAPIARRANPQPEDSVDISIILPVYNTGALLDECANSILAQNPGLRCELIVVDDGSGEDTAARVRALDGRAAGGVSARAIFQKNGGAAAARNRGLDEARGRYVMFVDADDLLLPGALAALYAAAEKHGADLAQGSWRYVDGPRQVFPEAVYEGENRAALIEMPGMPWGKLFRRTLFDGLRFPEEFNSYVDTPVKCLTLRMCKRAVTVPDMVYAWRRNPGGITFTAKSTPRALQTYWIMERMQDMSRELDLPEDGLYCAIWLRQMVSVSYDRLKGLDEDVRRDAFTLSRAFLADVLDRTRGMRLPPMLRLARRAFETGDFALWQRVGRYYAKGV